jgi:hypothetical protein
MASSQITATYRRLPAPTLAILILTAFAIGALTGLAVQGALDRASDRTRTQSGQTFQGVAENNMSDAANAAQHAHPAAGAFQGVADNNMSDAANAAQHDRVAPLTFKGVAENNMSDAARLAVEAAR